MIKQLTELAKVALFIAAVGITAERLIIVVKGFMR